RLWVGKKTRAVDECEQAVIIVLVIIIDQRMVVALATLQVHAEDQAADVAGEQIWFSITVESEPGRRAMSRPSAIHFDQLPEQSVQTEIGREEFVKERLPFRLLDNFLWQALHEPGIQRNRHVSHESRAGKQLIDQSLAFVRALIVN